MPMFAKTLYLKHYGYLLDDPDIFQIFFPGTYRSTRESKHNDVIVISGKKGSKKTTIRHYDFFLSDCLDDLNKQLQCTFY
jgi:hypothetical protein